MIDHGTARRSSATALDFELDADERERLDEHLRSCAACRGFSADLASDAAGLRDLDLGPVPVAVRAHVAILAERRERGRRRSGPVLLAAAALLVLVAIGGVAVGVGALSGGRGSVMAPVGRAVHWTTEVVDLQAEDLWLQVGGQVVVPPDDRRIEIDSDPGDADAWTLEAGWMAGRVEMRINLYFAADGTGWRIDEARIYDGRVPADWLGLRGAEIAGAPHGMAFNGDVDIVLPDRSPPDTGPGRLVMRGLRLAVAPRGDLAPVPANTGGPVPPLPAPPTDCGPTPVAICADLVERLQREVAASHPGRTIVSIVFGANGASTVTLDDGSVLATVDANAP